jgi:hypothetical protein
LPQPIQMLYTDFAVGLGMAYVYLPLMVLPLYASIEKLDFRLIEAAYDLYANEWRVLTRVVLPLARPGLVAGSILVFIPALGAYVVPRMLGGGNRMMIGNLIDLQFGQGRNWPLGAGPDPALDADRARGAAALRASGRPPGPAAWLSARSRCGGCRGSRRSQFWFSSCSMRRY